MSHSSQQKIDLAPGFPAVAAIPPVTGQAPATPGSSLTTAPTDAVGGRGNALSIPLGANLTIKVIPAGRYRDLPSDLSFSGWSLRAPGIEPCDGWALYQYDEEDSDGFITNAYFASNGVIDRYLSHARFWFDPTQERFDFLVRAGFPDLGSKGPMTNEDVDVAMVQARAALVLS